MRLLSFRHGRDRTLHAGVIDGTRVVDLALPDDALEVDGFVGPSLRRLLAEGSDAVADRVGRALERANVDPQAVIPLADAQLLAPIPDPDKIICLGLNYREHADEVQMETPPAPVLFAKFRNALSGAHQPIPCLPGQQLDYEGELAVVIGKACRRVTPERALEHIAGVTVLNDVSDRELQFGSGQWLPGKMLDGFAPCGPHLVTIDEIVDLQNLMITTRLNGKVVQHASTSEMIFPVAETIAYISGVATLLPGDIISTGTPSGIGFSREPQLFMRDGDVVEVEISQVGVLSNPILEASA